jgi:hypothetical protein
LAESRVVDHWSEQGLDLCSKVQEGLDVVIVATVTSTT